MARPTEHSPHITLHTMTLPSLNGTTYWTQPTALSLYTMTLPSLNGTMTRTQPRYNSTHHDTPFTKWQDLLNAAHTSLYTPWHSLHQMARRNERSPQLSLYIVTLPSLNGTTHWTQPTYLSTHHDTPITKWYDILNAAHTSPSLCTPWHSHHHMVRPTERSTQLSLSLQTTTLPSPNGTTYWTQPTALSTHHGTPITKWHDLLNAAHSSLYTPWHSLHQMARHNERSPQLSLSTHHDTPFTKWHDVMNAAHSSLYTPWHSLH